jgi:hypothetical protein
MAPYSKQVDDVVEFVSPRPNEEEEKFEDD